MKSKMVQIWMQDNGKALICDGNTFPLHWDYSKDGGSAEDAAVSASMRKNEVVYLVKKDEQRRVAELEVAADQPDVQVSDDSHKRYRMVTVRLNGKIAKAWLRWRTPELYLEALALLMRELDDAKGNA